MQTTICLSPISPEAMYGFPPLVAEMSDKDITILFKVQDDCRNAQFLGESWGLMKLLLSLYLGKEIDMFS